MKLIFLDIDDVLNDKDTPNVEHGISFLPSKLRRDIDPKKVELVNRIMDGAGGPDEVKFIASTSWRRFYGGTGVQELLAAKGFRGEIVGETPIKMSLYDRQSEIALWFDLGMPDEERDEPLPTHFLILDDKPMKGHWKRHALKTIEDRGLDERYVAMGINILMTRPAADTYAKLRAAAAREERRVDAMIERIGKRAKERAAAELEKGKLPGW